MACFSLINTYMAFWKKWYTEQFDTFWTVATVMLSEVMLRTHLQDLPNKKEPKTHSKPCGNPSTLMHHFAFSTWQSNRNPPKNKKTSRNDHTTRATFQENDNNKKKSPWWHLAKLKGGQKISAVAKSASVALSNGTNLRSKGSPAQANWDDGNGKVSKLPKMPWGFSPKAGKFQGIELLLRWRLCGERCGSSNWNNHL